MVRYDVDTRSITCTCCDQTVQVRYAVFSNPESLMILRDEFASEHLECVDYDTIERAIAHRNFRQSMRIASQQLARAKRNEALSLRDQALRGAG